MYNFRGSATSYNSLSDPYLETYFSRKRVQSHLKKLGLITNDGRIVPESTLSSNQVKIEQEERIRHMMVQEMVGRSLEKEKKTQQIIKSKLEEISKLETVRQKRNEELQRKLKMNDIFMPFISNSHQQKCHSACSSNNSFSRCESQHSQGSNLYRERDSSERGVLLKKRKQKSKHASATGRALSSLSSSHRNRLRPDQEKKPACVVKLHYYGRKHKFQSEDSIDYIKIEQQINEAASIIVFRGGVPSDSTFWFASCRKPNHKFSFTIYIDGLAYCSVSSCCEFKHKKGSRIGGKNGLFSFAGVHNGEMCYLCEESQKMKKHKKKSAIKKLKISKTNTTQAFGCRTSSESFEIERKNNEDVESARTVTLKDACCSELSDFEHLVESSDNTKGRITQLSHTSEKHKEFGTQMSSESNGQSCEKMPAEKSGKRSDVHDASNIYSDDDQENERSDINSEIKKRNHKTEMKNCSSASKLDSLDEHLSDNETVQAIKSIKITTYQASPTKTENKLELKPPKEDHLATEEQKTTNKIEPVLGSKDVKSITEENKMEENSRIKSFNEELKYESESESSSSFFSSSEDEEANERSQNDLDKNSETAEHIVAFKSEQTNK